MKLSSKGRYAVRALFDIAFYNEGQPTQVKDIADRQSIPPRFLEQIFQDLKRAGIVGSKRGPQGGYTLAAPADDIRLGDVIRALEGPISLAAAESAEATKARRTTTRTNGTRPTAPPSRVALDGSRVTDSVFRDLSERVESCFDAITIADICARAEQLGVRRPGPQGYVYVI